MPRRRRLTDAGIARLRPEPREYTVWDTRVRGLGVRVRPSGARTYIHHRPSVAGVMGVMGVKGTKGVKGVKRVRKVSLGPATARGIEEVRRACLAASAAAVEATPAVRNATPQLWEFVAGAWKSACFDRYTPSTQRSMRSALNSRLLPAFGAMRLDRIRRAPVVRWFDAYSRTAPGGANRALDVLRQILDHAVACGHIPTNPARTIRRNRRTKLTRFLSREEIPPPAPSARRPRRALRLRAPAGGHHPAIVADGLPQERDRAPALAGGGRRPPQPAQGQDRPEARLPQRAGACDRRAAEGGCGLGGQFGRSGEPGQSEQSE